MIQLQIKKNKEKMVDNANLEDIMVQKKEKVEDIMMIKRSTKNLVLSLNMSKSNKQKKKDHHQAQSQVNNLRQDNLNDKK
jgi:hypothetical protein